MAPEYDAFGRPVDSGSRGTAGPAEPPSPSGRPGGGPRGGGAPRPRSGPSSSSGPRRVVGCVSTLVVLFVLATIAVPVVLVTTGGDDAPTADREGTLERFRGTGDGRLASDAEGMLATRGTTDALDRLRARMRPGERVTSMSIRSEYLSAGVASGLGAPERQITIRGDDEDERDGRTATERGVALGALDVRAPQRLIAAVRRGLGPGSTATVSYVLLDVGDGADEAPSWVAYLEGARSEDARWTSDARGARVLRASDGAPAPPEGARGPARTPTGVEATSMVRPDNLRRAIALVRGRLPRGALVTNVDVRPRNATFRVRRSFRERPYTVDAALGLQIGDAYETSSRDGVPISSVNARGPERALRKVDARKRNRAPERVDYVILSPRSTAFAQSRTVWLVYLKGGHPNGRYWRASADGRRIGRAGEPGAP